MKLAEKILELVSISEMGKPRKDMVDLFDSLRETIVEHIWKIYAYGKNHRQKEVGVWLKSLNKHLGKLRNFNRQKGSNNKKNLTRAYFIDKLTGEDFENEGDIELMSLRWAEDDKPFPFIPTGVDDVKKLHILAERYIDLILAKKGKMSITKSEMGDY